MKQQSPVPPNIFAIAPDFSTEKGFFIWLLQWANAGHRLPNEALNETAQDFVRALIHQDSHFEITKVSAGSNSPTGAIWVEVNSSHLVLIKSKDTRCGMVEERPVREGSYKNHKLHFVYLQTGNEDLSLLLEVVEKGYTIIDRKRILKIMSCRTVAHEVFQSFYDHLKTIAERTSAYPFFANVATSRHAAEGFFLALQGQIGEATEWQYNSAATSGSLCFQYHRVSVEGVGTLCIQIENAFEWGITLGLKIADWEPCMEKMGELLNSLRPFAGKHQLAITLPRYFGAGETATLGRVQNAFTTHDDGNLDFVAFMQTLKRLEHVLEDYSAHCKTAQHLKKIQDLESKIVQTRALKNEVVKAQQFEKAAAAQQKLTELEGLLAQARAAQPDLP